MCKEWIRADFFPKANRVFLHDGMSDVIRERGEGIPGG